MAKKSKKTKAQEPAVEQATPAPEATTLEDSTRTPKVERSTMVSKFSKDEGVTLQTLAAQQPPTAMVPIHGADGIIIPGFKGVSVDGNIVEVRKDAWQFVEHKDMMLAVGEQLDKVGETYHVHRHWGNPRHQIVEAIIHQPFAAQEILDLGAADFRSQMRLSDEAGVYYPGVLIESNYWGGNTVSFNVYRALCTNGMMLGKILSKVISCAHTTKSVAQFFGSELEAFMTALFEGRAMDRVFQTMAKDLPSEKVTEFLQAQLGKRSFEANIASVPARNQLLSGKKVSAFAAYQLMTGVQSNTDITVGRSLMALRSGQDFFKTFGLKMAA